MRKLLLFFAMLCVSIGAWAMMPPGDPELFGTCGTEKVLKIDLEQAGQLSTALATAQQQGLDFQYLHLKTAPHAGTITLSDDDIAALNALDITTIDLQTANIAFPENKTLNNSKVSYIMLPLGWTKAQVKAVGETHKDYANFKACLSTSDTKNNGDATLIAYLGQANTLADAIRHTYFTKNDNNVEDTKTLGNGQGDCARLRNLVVMGNFCAKDISRAGEYDANGHYVTHGVADENSTVWNRNTDGGNVYNVNNNPNAVPGALSGCHQIESIDLSDGYVPDKYAADIVVGYCGIQVTNLREVWMPTDPRFQTVPADYLNINSNYIHQICIPGNIKYIMTRAFAGSGTSINYIWTTGPNATTKYDNGAYFVSGDDVTLKYKVNPDPTDPENIDFAAGDDNSFTYGTITLPPGIRLIERHAFSSSVNVKDVYVLNTIAPECHVDAFNSVLYHANNTVANDAIKEEDGVKIITRDAYTMSGYQMMAVLHYPRETATPQTQRYTDPSRDYNIATGERDGNGNMLYFPTQTEFETAHAQGTYGYLWGAWNTERTWYNNEKTLGTAGGWYGDICGTDGHDTQNGQGLANQFYNDNPNEDPDFDKTKNVFYDVTMSDANQPGGYTKPSDLADYWTLTRGGNQLYPQAKYETSNLIYVHDADGDYVKDPTKNTTTVFRAYAGSADDGLERFSLKTAVVTDDQGNPTYETCTNGNYVQDFEWVTDDAGQYVHDIEIVSNNNDGKYVLNYDWEEATDGTHYHPLGLTDKPSGAQIYSYGDYAGIPFDATKYFKFENGNYVPFAQGYEIEGYNGDIYTISDNFEVWDANATDYIAGVNDTRYSKVHETDVNNVDSYHLYNATADAGEARYDIVDNGYVLATSADSEKQHYSKNYLGTYHVATAADAGEQRWCPVTQNVTSDTPITYSAQNDFRGWHQFVLSAVAHNSTIPFEPLRSWITDCDWWTICEPYDLRYSDLVKFFGYDRQGFDKKIPYLSKLMYVIRDVENQKITLMFSKNLMEYKEVMAEGEGIVHGTINETDEGKWTAAELEANPVILHAGVPYLIRPNLVAGDNGRFERQFDIYKNQDPDLYQLLKDAKDVSAGKQFQMVYNGEYTVPAYVVGYDAAGAVSEATTDSKTITNKDGSSFTYNSGTIKYNGKNVNYKISDDFSYTFVGTFYKSAMPQYCYFLGYDSAKQKAVFRYSHVLDKNGWNWNNETGIICPNFETSLQIHQASSMNDPARWVFNPNNKTDNVDDYVKCDDFPAGSGGSGSAKQFTMDFGASSDNVITGISEMKVLPEATVKDTKIYTLDGISVDTSVKNLPKGIYIVNGKKYVVK